MPRIHRIRILLIALLLLVFAAPAPAAHAAFYGPGFDLGLGRIGAYLTPAGTQAYCLEIAKDRPLGVTDGGTVGGWAGLGPEDLVRLNWVLHRYGQSSDPVVAAAVNLYVWSVADPATYGSHGMSGDDYYSGRAGAARGAVLAQLAEIRSSTAAIPAAGTIELELAPDLTGHAIVADPGARGATLTIAGADLEEPIAVADGDVVEFVAELADGARTAAVEATAVFAEQSYPASITVFDSGPAQHLAGPAGGQLVASASAVVSLEFHPVLSSSVADQRVAVGEPVVDMLGTSVADGSPAPWRPGAVVIADGVLFGPFDAPPAEADVPPVGAPTAWTESVELDAAGGFASSGDFVPTEPGHYTWVWTIDADRQPPGTLLPDGYRWSDRFGLPAESFEVVPALPATGVRDDPSPWLAGSGAVLFGSGLVGIAAALGIRLASGPPDPRPARSHHRRPAAP